MKKHFTKKIIIMALAVVLVSVCACIAIFATESTQTYGETLDSVSASVGGKVSLKFIYSDLGSATAFAAEVYKADGTTFVRSAGIHAVSESNKTVSVSLTPSEMANIVKVYPVTLDADGKITARGEGKSYSVRQYALDVIASNDEKHTPHHNTMRALLNWGAMAEKTVSDVAPPFVNDGLYTRGTNPISGVTESFATDKGSIVENTGSYGCVLTFDINENIFNFYFTGLTDGTYTATVYKGVGESKKEVGTATAVKDTVTVEGEIKDAYKISISNVGVAVYDETYTVELKNSENTTVISASGNVRYYLSELAFATGENAKYNDIAKSMYQLYTLAMNKTAPATCKHTEAHWLANEAAPIVECSVCFTAQGTVPFYTSAANIKAQKYQDDLFRYSPKNKTQIKFESTLSSDSEYIRLTNMTVAEGTVKSDKAYTRFQFAARWSDTPLVSGVRYLVIKYRMGNTTGSQKLDIYAANKSATGWNAFQPNAIADEQWHTVVIDLYNTAYDGTGTENLQCNATTETVSFSYLQIQPFGTQRMNASGQEDADTCPQVATQPADAYIDFAYVAACDSFAALSGIIDQPTYSFNNKTYYTEGIGADDKTECTVELMRSAATLKTGLTANPTPFYSVKGDNRTAMAAVHNKTEEFGFIRLSAPKFPETTLLSDWPYITYNIIDYTSASGGIAKDSAKYVVFKYRIGADNKPVDGATAVNYINCLAGNTQYASGMAGIRDTDKKQIKVTQDGNWHTVVIDLSIFTTYNDGTGNLTRFWIEPFIVNSANCYDNQFVADSKETGATVKPAWQDGAYMDFAYVAVCSQYSDLAGIIDQPTYDFNGVSYNTADITNTAPAN